MSLFRRQCGNGHPEVVNPLDATLAVKVPSELVCSVVKLTDTGNTSIAVTLPAAANVAAGTWFFFMNATTGTKTITRAGSDTINGATTLALSSGLSAWLVSDGVSKWGAVKSA